MLQYLSERKKINNRIIVGTVTNLTVLAFCLVYSFLCLGSGIVFKSFKDTSYNDFSLTSQIMTNVILVFVASLQIPFKFFLEKEFLFIIYDELVNQSVSKKILEMRKTLMSDQQYSHLTVKKLSDQHYQLVREPYLKLSTKEYRILTSSVYILNIVLLFIVKNPFIRPKSS